MKSWQLTSLLLLSATFHSPAATCAQSRPDANKRVCEMAEARALPDGAPKAADVIMRSLTLRKGKDENQHDTFRALSDFHVTRLEWAYIRDKDAIGRFRKSGGLFGGAASSSLSHVAKPEAGSSYADLACLNLRGEPVVPTWKRTWRPPGSLWMCVNNSTLEERYLEYLKSCLVAGAQVMQRDEPSGNARAVDWGGCFCEHCMRAFRDYLAENTTPEDRKPWEIGDLGSFDYRELLKRRGAPVGDDFKRYDGGPLKQTFIDFQTETTIAFHKRTRQALNEYARRRVSFSCNNGCRRWTPIELEFDWCFGELSYRHAEPGFIHSAMRQAARLGRHQVVTMPKKSDREELDSWRRLTRRTIATAYACGGHCMVPWDVYMPSDAPRYFGTASQYADLFGFIRANSQYLDGYEYAGAFGPGIESDSYGHEFPVQFAADNRVCAVLRAIPGGTDRAVVMHLVDWSDEPRPFRVTLNPLTFFGGKPLKLTLLTPAPYDKSRQAKAVADQSYGPLVETTSLDGGYATSVSLPALRPWGLVVVEPDQTLAGGVWQPAMRADESDFFRDVLGVSMTTASSGASLHFTTDGSKPTPASPQYTGPIELSDSTVLNGIAVSADGRTSRVASASFKKTTDGPVPVAPDGPGLRDNLKLWLAADTLALPDGAPVRQWTARVGPDAVAQPHKTFDGSLTEPPTYEGDAFHGRPAVRFDGIDDSLAVGSFANRCLAGKAFSVFMVSQSENDGFGMCGNGIWGSGGMPRLYMQRGAFRYDELGKVVNLRPAGQGPTISVFMHDGRETIRGGSDGVMSGPVSGLPVVEEFGSGGNLAIPFWSGNMNCAGAMAEIVVFDRQLTEAERAGVEAYLADKYAIRYARRWE